MGIRGLTTFIQSRSHLYMDPFELHNTDLVIDGYAIACQLYRWHCPGANDCFGGDYDMYGKVVSNFFQLLLDCSVTPYVVFDGGYENRKVATVISRMKNKICTASTLDSVSEGSISVFPLFLRECFEEVINKLGVKKVRCDYEGDSETANIAKFLNCPVLSYDSDFFIFDILYIPFRTFELKSKIKVNGISYKYIPCEVYRIDKFLNSYGGMDKNNLPILAVLLGNDYVRRSVFARFFQNLKIQKCQKNQNEQQRRIKSLIVWLQNETIESAIRKVLSRYKKYNRPRVFEKIQNAIQGYYFCNSKYLEYLGIQIKLADECTQIDFSKILVNNNEDDGTEVEIDEESVSENECSDNSHSELESLLSSEKTVKEASKLSATNPKLPHIFLEHFRKCQYPACFMDIILQNKYYCIPQVENVTLRHSHSNSYEILSVIQKILRDSSEPLSCFTRIQNTQVGKEVIPVCEKKVPKLVEINSFSLKERQNILLNVLEIEENFKSCILHKFPDPWTVFVLALKYVLNKFELSLPLMGSLVLCKIVLECLDKKVGFYRNKKSFDKKFATKLKAITVKSTSMHNNEENISDVLDISYSDSINALSKLLAYFDMEDKLKTHRKSFDRNLVHNISVFQSCLLHIKYLNCVLNYPFSDLQIAQSLNCTFVYNFTSNLRKRTNCDNYLKLLLGDSPTVLFAYQFFVNNFKNYCNSTISSKCPPRKRRKKKNQVSNDVDETELFGDNSDEELFDPNNKFSVLAVS